MENFDTKEKIITAIIICLLIIMSMILWKSIRNNKKDKEKYKRTEKEIELKQLQLLMFKRQLRMICEFLPDPDETIPFEKIPKKEKQ